jgi:hypothetical protein
LIALSAFSLCEQSRDEADAPEKMGFLRTNNSKSIVVSGIILRLKSTEALTNGKSTKRETLGAHKAAT